MSDNKKILITGGTGLIGTCLTTILVANGYQVAYLSRKDSHAYIPKGVEKFEWDLDNNYIDLNALKGLHGIVHLAGANIGELPWTDENRKRIIESRTKSSELLIQSIGKTADKPQVFVSASAIGYYGLDTGADWVNEGSPRGSGFPAEVTQAWEEAVEPINRTDIRLVKLRIGIVLSLKSGALPKLLMPIRWGVGAVLGPGTQYISWVHIEDMAHIILKSIENQQVSGVYNAVASNPITNSELTKTAARLLSRPLWLPKIPGFVLKKMLGEMANVVIGGNRVSNKKLLSTGFTFKFDTLEKALADLLKQK